MSGGGRLAGAVAIGLVALASVGPRVAPDAADLHPPFPAPDPRFHCTEAKTAVWNPLHGLEFTGRFSALLPAGTGSLVLIVGDAAPLTLVAETETGSPALVRLERLPGGAGTPAPPAYWLQDGDPWKAPPGIVRATVDGLPARERYLSISLGRRAPRVIARLAGYPSDAHARLCAMAIEAPEAFAGTTVLTVRAPDAAYFGTGWYGEERDDRNRPVRWMSERGALLIPSARRTAVKVRLDAMPAAHDDAGDTWLQLSVNDVFAGDRQRLQPRPATYEWVVPDRAWVMGTNELMFTASRTARDARDARPLGLALDRLELTSVP